MSSRGSASCGCYLWPQMWPQQPPLKPLRCGRVQVTVHTIPEDCAAWQCQGPQGQLPRENAWPPSGCSNILKVSTTTGAFQLWLLDSPLWPSWASEPSLAAAFALLLPGQGTGEQHISRSGTRDKAKRRDYVTKEEDDCAHWKQVQAGVKPD